MTNRQRFYIDGAWVKPSTERHLNVVNPATEQVIDQIAMGGPEDVDSAVAAARSAFHKFSGVGVEERIALLERIVGAFESAMDDLADAISLEVGAPTMLARFGQAAAGLGHFATAIDVLRKFDFEETVGTTRIIREPIGVCALITPWNWPINQIACKVAPVLAAGCTMILKPSEIAPLNAIVFAEIMQSAGVPDGVFNLVNGDGATVGTALTTHPEVDMVSFTGSTSAGVQIAQNAAPTVKRVAQELGGKSANVILEDADFGVAIERDVRSLCMNSGQSCNAPARMLVPASRMQEAAAIARAAADQIRVGDPADEQTEMGPVVSAAQFDRIQEFIRAGIDEGATLETGGLGRPDGLDAGWFVRPTVFSNATNDMTIAREEIFGPVLTLIPYEDEDDAIRIANDTRYGLSGYVSSADSDRAAAFARKIRAGNIHLNGARVDQNAPFGGYKQSGNGREAGRYGLEEFLEVKAILGCGG